MSKKNINKKHIAMLAHTFYRTDARVQRLAECLAAAGYETHVICMREPARIDGWRAPRKEVINGAHIHRVCLIRKRGSMARYFYEYIMMTFLVRRSKNISIRRGGPRPSRRRLLNG